MTIDVIPVILVFVHYLVIFGMKAYEKIHPRFRQLQEKKFQRYVKLERLDMFHRLLAIDVYPLGYKENTYLREDVTSIYSSFTTNKKFFRVGDDGTISSKALSVDEIEAVRMMAIIIQEFIACWQNGYIIHSTSLKEHRIIAMFGALVLVANCMVADWPIFTIWEYKNKLLINGKCIGNNYTEAKEAFVEFLLRSHLQYNYEEVTTTHEIKKLTQANKLNYV